MQNCRHGQICHKKGIDPRGLLLDHDRHVEAAIEDKSNRGAGLSSLAARSLIFFARVRSMIYRLESILMELRVKAYSRSGPTIHWPRLT